MSFPVHFLFKWR